MHDQLVRAVACDGRIRIIACTSTELCEKARLQHDCWPTSAAALGRVLTMTAMMASMEKQADNRVIVSINGQGAIGTIMAEGWGNGDVRGFVGDPHLYLKYNSNNKLAVGLVVGTNGELKVTRSLGLKENFTGQVALQSGEIGDDFTYYYAVSEQTPSAISLGVLVDVDYSIKAAGGWMIQMMPDATEEDIVLAEKAVAQNPPVSEMVDQGKTAREIACSLFENVEILEEKTFRWHCTCNRDRFYGALTTLPQEDLMAMIEEDHGCEIKCEYCNEIYKFSEEDLKNVLEFKKACGK